MDGQPRHRDACSEEVVIWEGIYAQLLCCSLRILAKKSHFVAHFNNQQHLREATQTWRVRVLLLLTAMRATVSASMQ